MEERIQALIELEDRLFDLSDDNVQDTCDFIRSKGMFLPQHVLSIVECVSNHRFYKKALYDKITEMFGPDYHPTITLIIKNEMFFNDGLDSYLKTDPSPNFHDLNTAVRHGAIKCFKYMMMNNYPLNEATPKWATLGGSLEIVEMLMEANVSFRDCQQRAVTAHRNDLLDFFVMNYGLEDLSDNVSVLQCNTHALMKYGKFNDFNALKSALNLSNNIVAEYMISNHYESFDGNKSDLVYTAVYRNLFTCAKYLIEKGAIEKSDGLEIYYACLAENDNTEILKYLIASRCTYINSQRKVPSGFIKAINTNQINKVKLLLSYADINELHHSNEYPLITCLSTKNYNKEIAKLLVSSGANVNEKDSFGYTPLILATMNGDSEIVKLLIEKGADINIRYKGSSLLSLAFNSTTKNIILSYSPK